MIRKPADIGFPSTPQRQRWRDAVMQIRIALQRFGVVLGALPGNFNGMVNLINAANAVSPYLSGLHSIAAGRGVQTGTGEAMNLARVGSILAELQVQDVQAAQDAAAMQAGLSPQGSILPVAAAAPVWTPYGATGASVAPYQAPNYGPVQSASYQPLGGVGPGYVYGVQTEDGTGGSISLPAAGGGYTQQALDSIVSERAREIQAEVDDLPEYGEVTANGTNPTVGKLSGFRKIRQTSGYMDAVLVIGTAGTRCTLWAHAEVNDSDDWDDTDAATDASATGKPYFLIVPEDGFLVVPVRIEGACVLALECKSTTQRADFSRFKSRAHCVNTGGGHFSALGR